MKAGLLPIGYGVFGLGKMMANVANSLANCYGYEVELITSHSINLSEISERYDIEMRGVNIRSIPQLVKKLNDSRYLYRKINHLNFSFFSRQFDLFWVQTSYIPYLSFSDSSFLQVDFPFDRSPRANFWKKRLDSYQAVIANSEFTQYWIQKYWGVASHVIYPPIFPIIPAKKKPWILCVGRFVSGRRDKKQLELIEAFKHLCDNGLVGWQFNIVGIIQDQNYFDAVLDAAQGYPIRVYPNTSFNTLAELYAQSSIFWHAVGLGINPEDEPHRLEHFGMVTAEAMTAKCVPVVIGLGGQREIVENNYSGFLCN